MLHAKVVQSNALTSAYQEKDRSVRISTTIIKKPIFYGVFYTERHVREVPSLFAFLIAQNT